MRRLIGGAVLLALAGCGGDDASEANLALTNVLADNGAVLEAGPILGGVDLSQRVQVSGKRPEWLLDLSPGTIYLWEFTAARSEPDQLYFVSPEVTGDTAVYDTSNLKGEAAVLTLTASECADPTTAGKTFPLTAKLVVGARTLQGCAAQAEVLPEAAGGNEAAPIDNITG